MTTIDIHRENGNTIRAEGVLSSPQDANQLTRGGTTTLELQEQTERFVVVSDQTIASGETKQASETIIRESATLTVNGTLETGELTVTDNGTLDNNGTVTITGDTGGFDTIEFAPRAGGFVTEETLDSTIKFTERLPSGGSLLVGVEPDDELQGESIPGVWGLIESWSDSRDQALATNQATVEVTVLARYEQFNDHTAVRNQLEL